MRKKIKNLLFISLTLSIFLFISISCDNDNDPSANDDQCEYAGFTYEDNNNNNQILISETNLNTQFFPNASNGPYGAPGVEIAGESSSGNFVLFVTNVINEGDTGIGYLMLVNDGQETTVNVICQRAGTAIGEEFRFDITDSGLETEFCVVIDEIIN
ncbi:MAG: hypothetical protein L3J09_09970 [Flavobacteriaceae bacterium]|nr:hypothetical protein [Flavobacteriaceae bacterium]